MSILLVGNRKYGVVIRTVTIVGFKYIDTQSVQIQCIKNRAKLIEMCSISNETEGGSPFLF